jgi:hypothetical protein
MTMKYRTSFIVIVFSFLILSCLCLCQIEPWRLPLLLLLWHPLRRSSVRTNFLMAGDVVLIARGWLPAFRVQPVPSVPITATVPFGALVVVRWMVSVPQPLQRRLRMPPLRVSRPPPPPCVVSTCATASRVTGRRVFLVGRCARSTAAVCLLPRRRRQWHRRRSYVPT